MARTGLVVGEIERTLAGDPATVVALPYDYHTPQHILYQIDSSMSLTEIIQAVRAGTLPRVGCTSENPRDSEFTWVGLDNPKAPPTGKPHDVRQSYEVRTKLTDVRDLLHSEDPECYRTELTKVIPLLSADKLRADETGLGALYGLGIVPDWVDLRLAIHAARCVPHSGYDTWSLPPQ